MPLKLSHPVRRLAITLVVLVSLSPVVYAVWDSRGKPYCHKQIMLAFHVWQDESRNINVFPNASGHSVESLTVIRDEMGGKMDWAKGYQYIPGLNNDDPGDLVLMYLTQPTRWTSHVQRTPTIFTPRKWILVPLDFKNSNRAGTGPGELSERVSFEQFTTRLQRTIDYVRTNQRPNWQTIVAEHAAFLENIRRVDQ